MASGGTPSTNRVFLFRLQTLIVDGGTLVLRNMFDQRLPNLTLNVFLTNEKASINRLRGQKILTETQYDLLYPQSGQLPNSSDFDITLIICLLRNLNSLGLNHRYKWNATPQPADTSVEADLCRLKWFRNEVAHISSTSGIQPVLFQTKWTEIEQVLLRLNSAVSIPDPTLRPTIDSYKNDLLDPVAEKRIQKEIDKWRKLERGLETEMLLMQKDIKEINQSVDEVSVGVTKVQKDVIKGSEEVQKVDKNVMKVSEEVKKVGKDVMQVSEEVKEVGKHVIQVNEEVEQVDTYVKSMTEDVKEVGKDVLQVSEEVNEVGQDVLQVIAEVKDVEKGVMKVSEEVTEVGKDVIEVSDEVKEVAKTVSKVSGCITEVREIKEDVKEMKQHVLTQSFSKLETDTKEDAVSDSGRRKKPGIVKRVKKFFSSRKSRRLKELPSAQVKTPILGQDDAYLKMTTEIQEDLISFYRRHHTKMSISPLLEEDSTPLLDFYVMPEILLVKMKRLRGGAKEEKQQVAPFRNVFYKDDTMCSEIYLTADAGLGKTALSKRLALTWCHTKKPLAQEKRYFSTEDIEALEEFRFVFLVFLRNSASECEVDNLIMNEIVSRLRRRYSSENLGNILARETCLVILDGLDEWNHPSNPCEQGWSFIPHRKVRENTVVLTTTRPWKLSEINLKSNQIDQKLEIIGLNQTSVNTLKRSVISHLFDERNEDKLKQHATEFTTAVGEKRISDLESIPLLLMYLLFLWYYKMEIGQSHCDLYSNIVELLMSRSMQNVKEISFENELSQGDIPHSFSKQIHCRKYYPLLAALGKLAYKTLFGETRQENTLVFESSVAEQFLNEDCLNACLSTGIITKIRVPGTFLEHISKVSFAHKTVQEFFAALYIRSIPDQISVSETVLSKFKCVNDILEMSKIIIFLSGLDENVSRLIIRELMEIINKDEITRRYRSSLFESDELKQFQDMCVSCCKELQHVNEVNLCLQDVFIDDSCQQEQYRENLKQLTAINKQNIKSLYIDMSSAPDSSAHKVIEYFALSDLENIEKIHFQGKYENRDILSLLNKSVKSLSLAIASYFYERFRVLPLEKVTSLHELEAINVDGYCLSHEQLKVLCGYVSQTHCMRQIRLICLECTDHNKSCSGFSLDLTQHSQLRKIKLCNILVSELNINMTLLDEFDLRNLTNPDLVVDFKKCVPADSKVYTFKCDDLESSAAIETIQKTLPLLTYIEDMQLWNIDLGNGELLTSKMVNIQRVQLRKISMPASVLRGIVAVLQKLQQTVEVDIEWCEITPEREFVTVKEAIKRSPTFRVIRDSEDRFGKNFKFDTIKDSD